MEINNDAFKLLEISEKKYQDKREELEAAKKKIESLEKVINNLLKG